ncbi:hypothetical protein Hanom_Chr10g00881981 [Helianthus anomalus]
MDPFLLSLALKACAISFSGMWFYETAIITELVCAGFNMEGISYLAKLCRNNMAYDSYKLAFLRMRELEVIPNEYTPAAVISGCANTAQIDLGQKFHGLMLERIYT